MNSLSIVHTESSLGWGGQEIRILTEAKGLITRGYRVQILCPAKARIYAESARWGVPAQALPIGAKGLKGLSTLAGWFYHHRCDVINTHSSTDSWLTALAMFTLGRPIPIVRTRHISARVPKNARTRWLYTRATAKVVTTGEMLRERLIEDNGFPAERIVSVPTGVDTARFVPGERTAARERCALPQDRTLIGIVATLRSWKGHRFLLEALNGLPAGMGLVIVGDGPQREALQALVKKWGLEKRVWMPGDQTDVLPWLRALDIFALPSYANEGVPQALVQAMLVGLPCVTTTAGSIAELAAHGRTALVVPQQNVHALRSALAALAAQPGLRAALGAAARAHCLERFSLERMLDAMETVFQEVCRDAGKSTEAGRGPPLHA